MQFIDFLRENVDDEQFVNAVKKLHDLWKNAECNKEFGCCEEAATGVTTSSDSSNTTSQEKVNEVNALLKNVEDKEKVATDANNELEKANEAWENFIKSEASKITNETTANSVTANA